jgi:hypothetical protein
MRVRDRSATLRIPTHAIDGFCTRDTRTDHPAWGVGRIAEALRLKLGVRHSTSTVRRDMGT